MRIDIYSPARVWRTDTDTQIEDPAFIQRLDGLKIPHAELFVYLDEALQYRGIIGGTLSIHIRDAAPCLRVSWGAPELPDELTLRSLVKDTMAQLSDGAGEGGFEVKIGEQACIVDTDANIADASIEMNDDGVAVPRPSPLSQAVRQGDLREVQRLLAAGFDANVSVGLFTTLQRAILSGRRDICEALIAGGARVDERHREARTLLFSLATAREMADEDAAALAAELIHRGVETTVVDANGWTAADFAKNRGKSNLLETLMKATATSGPF